MSTASGYQAPPDRRSAPPFPPDHEDEDALPFDPATLALRLARRWRLYAAAGLIAAVVGVFAALLLGSRTFEAETVLLYKADRNTWASMERAPSLGTINAMVKMPTNIEAVRQRLGMSTPLGRLGSRFTVRVHENTTLMSIKAEADRPELAADMANTLREVFLESQRDLRHQEADHQISTLEVRLATVDGQLAAAEAALNQFNRDHGLVDLEKESQWSLEELLTLDADYQATLAQSKSLESQLANLRQAISEQQTQASADPSSKKPQAAGAANLSSRIEQLRRTIESTKERQVDQAEVSARKAALERADQLRREGLISDAGYELARSDYNKSMARTRESRRTRAMRDELESLEAMVASGAVPEAGAFSVLQGMQLKALDVQLSLVASEERLAHLQTQREQLRTRLDSVPGMERTWLDLQRQVTTVSAERDSLQSRLEAARHVKQSEAPDFVVAAVAMPPEYPVRSNRRLLFAGIVALGLGAGLAIGLALELLGDTIVSEAEASLKLKLRVLGVLPWVPGAPYPCANGDDDILLERFMLVASSLQHRVAGRAQRILVVAAGPGEGTSLVVNGLAGGLARMGERVLVIDGHVRGNQEDPLAGVLGEALPPLRAAREALSRQLLERWDAAAAWVSALGAELRRRLPLGAPVAVSRRGDGATGGASLWMSGAFARSGDSHGSAGRPLGSGGAGRSASGRGGRPRPAPHLSISSLLIADWERGGTAGLGEYLSRQTNELSALLWPTRMPGVDCVPSLDPAPSPDLVGSPRMTSLLEAVQPRYSFVLIDAPPALPYVDAELLARHCDAVVLVVGSGRSSAPTIRRALGRLGTAGAPVAGVVLNAVERPFLRDL